MHSSDSSGGATPGPAGRHSAKQPGTSCSSPLLIAEVPVPPAPGCLGLTICPGKKDPSRGWDRDLHADIDVIRKWGAVAVLTLIEDHEFSLLCVEGLGDAVRAAGMVWHHLPIVDVSVPDRRFEQAWMDIRATLHQQLDAGQRILIHCRGGLGRSGLVAGTMLAERGVPSLTAIDLVRKSRPGAIETFEQERYVRDVQASCRGGL